MSSADMQNSPGGDPVVLRVGSVRLSYGDRQVLRDVDLTVRRGEFWFLLGPNGVGKTTLLRAVLGVLPPQGGRIELCQELRDGRRIGFVPQRCSLKPTLPMSVSDFVLLGLARTGISRGEAKANLAWALEEVGLGDKALADYWSLSGGQRQRALVARSLVRRPDLLILDEPTNGLDLPAEESFLLLLSDLNRGHGITVFVVTHTVGLAARFATHVAIISGGRLLAGRKETILVGENLREAYGVDVVVSYDDPHQPTVRIRSVQ